MRKIGIITIVVGLFGLVLMARDKPLNEDEYLEYCILSTKYDMFTPENPNRKAYNILKKFNQQQVEERKQHPNEEVP